MTTLNDFNRRAILNDLLEHRFGAQQKELVARGKMLADTVYMRAMGDKIELAKSLPAGWLPVSRTISVYAAGVGALRMEFNGDFHERLLGLDDDSVLRELPASMRENGYALRLGPDDALAVDLAKWVNDRKSYGEEVRHARDVGMATLKEYRSIKRLIEAWPEIAVFAEKHMDRPVQLPALPIKTLNTVFDLPVDDGKSEEADADTDIAG